MSKSVVAGLAGAVVALGLAVVPAQAQSAPTASELCGWAPRESLTAIGTIVKSKAAVHTGPGQECLVTEHRALNSPVEIFCKYRNSAQNIWYNTTFGWIYSPYIDIDRGTVATC
ncbi:hypothetical protein ABZ707_05660 [Streptomyces sp. NPDC006923]|uniref:hypothetical protein n=1 Tax=Streptomyces sp. NPDC006923 TaxID=3155355 RepID=UPI0033D07AD4